MVLAFLFGRRAPGLIHDAGARGWVTQLLLVMVVLDACTLLYDPVIDGWLDLVHDRRWGLSTQTGDGFVVDLGKGFVLGLAANAALIIPLYAVMRATSWWWLWGWLVVVAGSAVFGLLLPVVIGPVFNHFTPLPSGALADRVHQVVEASGVPVRSVVVADQSRRSTRENAYVAGLGRTRRLVLYDTLLDRPPEQVAQVVAHELGHWRRHHLAVQLVILALCTLAVFGLLWGAASWQWLLHRAGVSTLGEPASLPVVLVAAGVGFTLTGLVNSAVSRALERRADLDALELLGAPDAHLAMLRSLYVRNLSDLAPGRWRRLFMTHPPVAERMALASEWAHRGGRLGPATAPGARRSPASAIGTLGAGDAPAVGADRSGGV